MERTKAKQNIESQKTREGVSRKKYSPPRILHREPLEVMAAVCNEPGKDPANPICNFFQS